MILLINIQRWIDKEVFLLHITNAKAVYEYLIAWVAEVWDSNSLLSDLDC